MMEILGGLIRHLVILIFLATLLEMILPHGQFRRYLRMLVGILLILTLLSPIKQIMRLAPVWDTPVFLAVPSGKEELAMIMQRGKKMRDDGLKEAINDYRYHIFIIVENLLAREYGGDLIELEVVLDEDPESPYFGAIKNMIVFMVKISSNNADTGSFPVEEVNISVARGQKRSQFQESEKAEEKFPGQTAEEAAIAKYLAGYFLLADERVSVNIVR